jgi:hypothetical protein
MSWQEQRGVVRGESVVIFIAVIIIYLNVMINTFLTLHEGNIMWICGYVWIFIMIYLKLVEFSTWNGNEWIGWVLLMGIGACWVVIEGISVL